MDITELTSDALFCFTPFRQYFVRNVAGERDVLECLPLREQTNRRVLRHDYVLINSHILRVLCQCSDLSSSTVDI